MEVIEDNMHHYTWIFFHCDCEELMGVNLFGIFTVTAIYIFETLTEHNLQTCMPFI